MKCEATQHGDITVCTSCNLQWDTNDPSPPACNRAEPALKKIGSIGLINKDETWARVLLIVLNKLRIKQIVITDADIQSCVDNNPSLFCMQETDERFLIKIMTPEEASSTMEKYNVEQ